MNFNKKGAMTTTEIVIFMVVALFAALVLIYIFGKFTGAGVEQFNSQVAKIQSDACKLKGERAKAEGTKFTDDDFGPKNGDGYPDSCDICLGGNNAVDSDLDGIPDACDNDPNKLPLKGMTYEKVCQNGVDGKSKRSERSAEWKKETSLCQLTCYLKTPPNNCQP